MKKAYLVLENGKVFEGKSIGAEGEAIGELVFTTSAVGYLETLTDPCYTGQIIMHTFPLIGNYGVIEEDLGGKCPAAGYVVRECCDTPSNFRCQYDLDTYLKNNGIVGICDIDTREITGILRENGVMNAKICQTVPSALAELFSHVPKTILPRINSEVFSAESETKYRVALINYGATGGLIKQLTKRGCEVKTFPCDLAAEEIISYNPDGIVLSGGPGNPSENTFCIKLIKKLMGKFPIFGIGLGHQLAAIAMGAEVLKLKCGHRGSNQPVKELDSGRIYVTNQNHGYAIAANSLGSSARVTHINANDLTCEGIDYPVENCFTLQFEPANETVFMFDKFISMMEAVKDNA